VLSVEVSTMSTPVKKRDVPCGKRSERSHHHQAIVFRLVWECGTGKPSIHADAWLLFVK